MAVEVTEICLLWGDWQIQQWWSCMNRSEWASWVQAVGSILAICGAVFIAWWQWRNFKINESERRDEISNVIGREVLSVVQEQISILEKLQKELMHAKAIGGLQEFNQDFFKWCLEILPDCDLTLINQLQAVDKNSVSSLAQARGSIRQIKNIGLSGKFSLPAVIQFVIPIVQTGLQCLYIGRSGLHEFLKINPNMSPMYKFGAHEESGN
jgi:hypothetical protein